MSPRADRLNASRYTSSTSIPDAIDAELLTLLNPILTSVSLPTISNILDATPNLLIALYEALHKKRIPLVDRSSKSHTSFNSRVKNIKILIGTIAHEANVGTEGAVKLGEIDPIKVCEKDEQSLRELLWVLVRIGKLRTGREEYDTLETLGLRRKRPHGIGKPNTDSFVQETSTISGENASLLSSLHKSLQRRRELAGIQTLFPRSTPPHIKTFNWVQDLPSTFSQPEGSDDISAIPHASKPTFTNAHALSSSRPLPGNIHESNSVSPIAEPTEQKRSILPQLVPHLSVRGLPRRFTPITVQSNKPKSYPHATYDLPHESMQIMSAEISPVSTVYLEQASARIKEISSRLLPLQKLLDPENMSDSEFSEPFSRVSHHSRPSQHSKASEAAHGDQNENLDHEVDDHEEEREVPNFLVQEGFDDSFQSNNDSTVRDVRHAELLTDEPPDGQHAFHSPTEERDSTNHSHMAPIGTELRECTFEITGASVNNTQSAKAVTKEAQQPESEVEGAQEQDNEVEDLKQLTPEDYVGDMDQSEDAEEQKDEIIQGPHNVSVSPLTDSAKENRASSSEDENETCETQLSPVGVQEDEHSTDNVAISSMQISPAQEGDDSNWEDAYSKGGSDVRETVNEDISEDLKDDVNESFNGSVSEDKSGYVDEELSWNTSEGVNEDASGRYNERLNMIAQGHATDELHEEEANEEVDEEFSKEVNENANEDVDRQINDGAPIHLSVLNHSGKNQLTESSPENESQVIECDPPGDRGQVTGEAWPPPQGDVSIVLSEPPLIELPAEHQSISSPLLPETDNLIDLLSDPTPIDLPSYMRAISPVKQWQGSSSPGLIDTGLLATGMSDAEESPARISNPQSFLSRHPELFALQNSPPLVALDESACAIPLPGSEGTSSASPLLSSTSLFQATATKLPAVLDSNEMATSCDNSSPPQVSELLETRHVGNIQNPNRVNGTHMVTSSTLNPHSPTGSDSPWMDYSPIASTFPSVRSTKGKNPSSEGIFTSTPRKLKAACATTGASALDTTPPRFDLNGVRIEDEVEIEIDKPSPANLSLLDMDTDIEEMSQFNLPQSPLLCHKAVQSNGATLSPPSPSRHMKFEKTNEDDSIHSRKSSAILEGSSLWETEDSDAEDHQQVEDGEERPLTRDSNLSENHTWGSDTPSSKLQRQIRLDAILQLRGTQTPVQELDQDYEEESEYHPNSSLEDIHSSESYDDNNNEHTYDTDNEGEWYTTVGGTSSSALLNPASTIGIFSNRTPPQTPIRPSRQNSSSIGSSQLDVYHTCLSPLPRLGELRLFSNSSPTGSQTPWTPIRPRRLFSTPTPAVSASHAVAPFSGKHQHQEQKKEDNEVGDVGISPPPPPPLLPISISSTINISTKSLTLTPPPVRSQPLNVGSKSTGRKGRGQLSPFITQDKTNTPTTSITTITPNANPMFSTSTLLPNVNTPTNPTHLVLSTSKLLGRARSTPIPVYPRSAKTGVGGRSDLRSIFVASSSSSSPSQTVETVNTRGTAASERTISADEFMDMDLGYGLM